MSSSPPPGQWGGQPMPPGYGQPQPGTPPPGYQQPWYPPPGPPNKGRGPNWTVIGIVALVIVAVAAVVIVLVLHTDSRSGSKGSTAPPAASRIASANDNGPVTVITDDPSRATWTPIINTLGDLSDRNGWNTRDPAIPASAWTSEQRTMYQETAVAMRHAADQTVAPAKLTPHRVMRELYEQLIAYWRAYADSIANYTPIDDQLARVTNVGGRTVTAICDSITRGAAASRRPLVAVPKPPAEPAAVGDPAKPERFLPASNAICGEWRSKGEVLNAASGDWPKTDPSVPASQWSPQDKSLNDAFGPLLSTYVNDLEQLGRGSGNPVIEDFAVLNEQYGGAFVKSLPTYVATDQELYDVTRYITGVVASACKAVGN